MQVAIMGAQSSNLHETVQAAPGGSCRARISHQWSRINHAVGCPPTRKSNSKEYPLQSRYLTSRLQPIRMNHGAFTPTWISRFTLTTVNSGGTLGRAWFESAAIEKKKHWSAMGTLGRMQPSCRLTIYRGVNHGTLLCCRLQQCSSET